MNEAESMINFIFNEIENQNTNINSISEISGVSWTCINSWKRSGNSRRINPKVKNMIKVLNALGYELIIKKIE